MSKEEKKEEEQKEEEPAPDGASLTLLNPFLVSSSTKKIYYN